MMIEEQLFGAPLGDVNGVTLGITKYDGGRWGVGISVHPLNRKGLLTLQVTATEEQGIAQVIGAMVPLMSRANHLSVTLARRTLWALHNRLGAAGFEVEVRNCGHDPMVKSG